MTLHIQFAHEQLLRIFDVPAQTLHRRHRVGVGRVAFLETVGVLVGLGEDVWVVCGREDGVEVCLVEAFAGGEDFAGGVWRREGELIGGDADDWT